MSSISAAADARRTAGLSGLAPPVLQVEALGVRYGDLVALEQQLSAKSPRIVEFVDTLPKSATGKVMWRSLQEKEMAK